MKDVKDQIKELEKKIESLPKGTLVYKNINGKDQPYLQQTINGKSISTYIKIEDREKVIREIGLRNALTIELKELKKNPKASQDRNISDYYLYNTEVKTGDKLDSIVNDVKCYKKRSCFKKLQDYLYGNTSGRVFILYGLRRTGKTTLMKQAINEMSNEDKRLTAYIQIKKGDDLGKLNFDLRHLEEKGYKYIFIDEVTILDDFIEGAALLSDIYASSGMKVVLSGTDSLGFWLSEGDQLFDRTIVVHTTFIPYYEFENVLGIKGIDKYICFGGTMSIEGNYYNKEDSFKNQNIIDIYVDSSIAHNIQHSLEHYKYGDHFRSLYELYEKKELTSAINRVVEDTSHRFTMDVLTRNFTSHDLGISRTNLRKDVNNPSTILDEIDISSLTEKLKKALDILNKNEQRVELKDVHRYQIEEYLYALDLIDYIDIKTIPNSTLEKMTIITQPGLRYSQAKLLIENLLSDPLFNDLSTISKESVIERILNEIKGRMMEEMILLETSIAKSKKKVYKLLFDRGEYDMVLFDKENLSCEIYEIKHSDKIIEEQYRHLIDKEKCNKTEFEYGTIKNKYVLYRGESKVLDNGIKYINVEEYLKGLYKTI